MLKASRKKFSTSLLCIWNYVLYEFIRILLEKIILMKVSWKGFPMSFSVHWARPFIVLSKRFWRKRPTAEGYMGEVSHGLFCAFRNVSHYVGHSLAIKIYIYIIGIETHNLRKYITNN
jgi:hypothetical protein